MEHDKDFKLKNYLLPGYADYNYYKRLGRSQGDRDEAEPKNGKPKKDGK